MYYCVIILYGSVFSKESNIRKIHLQDSYFIISTLALFYVLA